MKTDDIDMIEYLLEQNELFFDNGSIDIDEYDENSFYLIERMEKMLRSHEKKIIGPNLLDEFSLPKFRISMQTIKAVIN